MSESFVSAIKEYIVVFRWGTIYLTPSSNTSMITYMTTHKTLMAAEAATNCGAGLSVVSIIEIDHSTQGRCYIGSRVPMATLATKPIPEILRMVTEYPVSRAAYVPPPTTCARCAARIQDDADYCASCLRLLAIWGANADEPTEPTHKSDV